jgi:hypothetical protein
MVYENAEQGFEQIKTQFNGIAGFYGTLRVKLRGKLTPSAWCR